MTNEVCHGNDQNVIAKVSDMATATNTEIRDHIAHQSGWTVLTDLLNYIPKPAMGGITGYRISLQNAIGMFIQSMPSHRWFRKSQNAKLPCELFTSQMV